MENSILRKFREVNKNTTPPLSFQFVKHNYVTRGLGVKKEGHCSSLRA